MAKTIHMVTFDPAEGSGLFQFEDRDFYVDINIGVVTIIDNPKIKGE